MINIPQIVGGNTAYVGFTGSTGGLTSSQKILTWTYSAQAQATTAAPVFSPAAGNYSTAQSVAISSATKGAVIYYTTNGTTPTTASTVYAGPMTVGTGTTTIEAIAVASGSSPSAVVTAKYVVGGSIPVNFPNGFTSSAGLALNQAATVTNGALQMTLAGISYRQGIRVVCDAGEYQLVYHGLPVPVAEPLG